MYYVQLLVLTESDVDEVLGGLPRRRLQDGAPHADAHDAGLQQQTSTEDDEVAQDVLPQLALTRYVSAEVRDAQRHRQHRQPAAEVRGGQKMSGEVRWGQRRRSGEVRGDQGRPEEVR